MSITLNSKPKIAEPLYEVYTYMGQRIRERRKQLKLNQSQLAEMMGFSYQQIQKYEMGASQLSVSKLLQFAQILSVPPLYFFDGAKIDSDIGQEIPSDIIQKCRTKPLQVLLVEDNASDVLQFRKALHACPEQVNLHVIHDPEAVSDYLQNHSSKYGKPQPDIIFFDLALPRIPGLQLLKTIKGNVKTSEIPVIILTNSISKKEMRKAYRIGAAGFMQKTVESDQFIEAIGMAMRYWSRAVALPVM